MTRKAKVFGFWLPIYNQDSAETAMKMGGLPILILGLNIALISTTNFMNTQITKGLFLTGLITALILIVFSFRIRGNKTASLPYLTGLFLCFFIVNTFISFVYSIALHGLSAGSTMFVITWIIPIFASLFAISELRGWWWMKKNNISMKF